MLDMQPQKGWWGCICGFHPSSGSPSPEARKGLVQNQSEAMIRVWPPWEAQEAAVLTSQSDSIWATLLSWVPSQAGPEHA